MGYLFLGAALFAGVTKGYCGKKTSFAISTASDSMIMNALRMSLCILIGFLLVVLNHETQLLKIDGSMLLISMLSGFSSAVFVISWLLSVRTGAYMMVEVFLLLGTTVAVGLCRLFFEEPVSGKQIAGMILLLFAIYMMCTYNSEIKGKMKPISLLLLVICGSSNGIADFSQKLFVKTSESGSALVFNFYTYVFSAVFLVCICPLFRLAERKRKAELRKPAEVLKPIWYYILIMAICLFANSFFKTQAALYLDAVSLYPLNQGCAVILSLLMSSVLFKEKINRKCVIGICMSFAALLLINLGG